jgi:hypothetical protein
MVSTRDDLEGDCRAVSAFVTALSAANSDSEDSLTHPRGYEHRSNLLSLVHLARCLPRPKSENCFPFNEGGLLSVRGKPFHKSETFGSGDRDLESCFSSHDRPPPGGLDLT